MLNKKEFVKFCDLLIADNEKHQKLDELGIDCSQLKEDIYKANSILLHGLFCEWKVDLIEDYLYPVFGGHEIKIYDKKGKDVEELIDSHEKLWEYLSSNDN